MTSANIADWRYRSEKDTLMSTLFIATIYGGHAKASDDIDIIEWFDINDLTTTCFVPEHRELGEKFLITMENCYANG